MTSTLSDARADSQPGAPRRSVPQPFANRVLHGVALRDWIAGRLRVPRVMAGFALAVGAVFLFFSHRPLWHTDLWGHLAYGRVIWERASIPATEPLMPLAADVRFVDAAWLSQLAGYGAYRAFGVPALQFLYAAAVAACVALLLWGLHRRTKSAWWSLAGGAAFLWIEWEQLLIVRPQLAGMICFILLLVLLPCKERERTATLLAVPVLFALWANLHGSFPVGLALVGAFAFGRAIDVVRRTRRPAAALRDGRARRYVLLVGLAAAGALVNPYGAGLYAEVLTFARNENLADLIEWGPLTLRMDQGRAFAAFALTLALAYRLTPRRVSATEVLLLAGLGLATLWTSRMIVWWGPVAAFSLAMHGSAIWNRRRSRRVGTASDPADNTPPLAKERLQTREGEAPAEPSFRAAAARREPRPPSHAGHETASKEGEYAGGATWAAVTLGLAWIALGFSPLGMSLLYGVERDLEQSVSAGTPVRATEYLRRHPSRGLVLNTYEWGDYLLWAGPDGIRVFVASHAHLVPRGVWQDYLRIIWTGAGWKATLDRYGVATVVIDPRELRSLAEKLRNDAEWSVACEDGRSVVFVRATAGRSRPGP